MADNSAIEWTNSTWNIITGCDKVSPGCKNCYAERVATRLQKMGVKKYANGFELKIHPDVMDYPLKLKKPKMIFVNSMSDLFHEKLSFDFIKKIIDFPLFKLSNYYVKDDRKSVISRKQNDRLIIFLM